MQKVIKTVNADKRTVQVTVGDERWYFRETEDKAKNPIFVAVPSVTWIAGHYPKGVEFYKWLANKGWDESQAIKSAAGDKGSKVHHAIEALLGGFEVKMESKFGNAHGEPEELALEEYEAILSFQAWFEATKPEIIATETVAYSEAHRYAGTIDFVCRIDGELWIVDFKTSKSVWTEYELQLSAYKHADHDWQDAKLAILQVGYNRNKAGYKWNEIEDKFDLFKVAQQIWHHECGDQKPKVRDYPLSLKLEISKEDVIE